MRGLQPLRRLIFIQYGLVFLMTIFCKDTLVLIDWADKSHF